MKKLLISIILSIVLSFPVWAADIDCDDTGTPNDAMDVNCGGTDATTLTDGGVLLGSGTGPVTPMAVLTDGQMIVGDGTTDPVPESGATLRTSIGSPAIDDSALTGNPVITDADPGLTFNDSTDAAGTANILFGTTQATRDVVATLQVDVNNTPVTYITLDGTNEDVDVAKPLNVAGKIAGTITTEQLRLSYDATNYLTAVLLDDGHTTFTTVDPDGAEADINFAPDGNVGIKTAAPSTALEVTGTVTATEFAGGGGSLTGVDAATGDSATDFFDAGEFADARVPDAHSHAADAIDAITEIAAALKSGSDGKVITGTAGTSTYTAVWNADGDLVDGADPSTYALTTSINTTAKLETVSNAGAYASDILDVTNQAGLTALIAAGTISTSGAVELATNEETVTGTDTSRAVTPDGLTDRLLTPGGIGAGTPSTGDFTTISAQLMASSLGATMANGGYYRIATQTNGHAWAIQIYDTDGAWVDAMTFTNSATPTITFNAILAGLGAWNGNFVSATNATDDLGSTAIGWDDLFLANGGVIQLGDDQDVTVKHVHDAGLNMKQVTDADDNPFILILQTGETDMAVDDVLGGVYFQAPDEGTGTAAILVAAGIEAVSEGDFAADSNATKLSFQTASSATAAETMSLSSGGNLAVTGSVTATTSFIRGTADLNETDLEKLDGITNGTQAANKAVVADANVNTGVSKVTELHMGTSGSEVKITHPDRAVWLGRDFSKTDLTNGATQTALSEATLMANYWIANNGGSAEEDILLVDITFPIKFALTDEEGTGYEVCPPSGEQFDLNNGETLLTADYCIESGGDKGDMAIFIRGEDEDGAWIWRVRTVQGAWIDGGDSGD